MEIATRVLIYRQHFARSSFFEQRDAAVVKFDPLISKGQSVVDTVSGKCTSSRANNKPRRVKVLYFAMRERER